MYSSREDHRHNQELEQSLEGICCSCKKGARLQIQNRFVRNQIFKSLFDRREKIIHALKVLFAKKTKRNVVFFGIKEKELRDFTTTDKDVEKGISRIPLPLARVYDEDILEEEEDSSASTKSTANDLTVEALDNYKNVMDHRNESYVVRTS